MQKSISENREKLNGLVLSSTKPKSLILKILLELLKIIQGWGGVNKILDRNIGGSILKMSKVWGGGHFTLRYKS